jgi:PAS domain S-box-containing protein
VIRDEHATIAVLHVDDEPSISEITAEMLEAEDDRFEVETAQEPAAGLERLAEGGIDCIVSDYQMPGRTGIEFLEAVRERHGQLPFILYTGEGSEAVAADAIAAGVTDYLQKEVGTSQYTVLANRIANAVEQRRAREALEASQRRFAMFFEKSPLGVIEWDENLELVRMNDAAEAMFGYEETELIGESWEVLVAEGDQPELEGDLLSLGEDSDRLYSINENVRKDGTHIRCEWHNHTLTDEDGNLTAVFSQTQEVTEDVLRRERRQQQHDALVELLQDEAVIDGAFTTAAERIVERSASILGVARAGIWVIENGSDRLECVSQYDRQTDTHDRGMAVDLDDYPAYRQALRNHRTIAAANVNTDSRTAELGQGYLDAHDVGSMLAAPLRTDGEVLGVVCHEHVGNVREWDDSEVQFAGAISDIVHRAYQNQQEREYERELQAHKRLLETSLDTATAGALVEGTGGTVKAATSGLCSLFELDSSAETLTGRDLEAIISRLASSTADDTSFRDTVETVRENGTSESQGTVALEDGRRCEWEYRQVSLPQGTGAVWAFTLAG